MGRGGRVKEVLIPQRGGGIWILKRSDGGYVYICPWSIGGVSHVGVNPIGVIIQIQHGYII